MTNSENIPYHVSLFSEAGLKSQDLKYIYIYFSHITASILALGLVKQC